MSSDTVSAIESRYTICGCDDVLAELVKRNYAAVISIEHPGAKEGEGRAPRLSGLGIVTPQHIFSFWDNDVAGGDDMFTSRLARQCLALLRGYQGQPLLIHCKAGKSRSAGIALMGIADELGAGREREAVDLLDRIRPICMPNPLIVRVADRQLGRRGKLIAAVTAHAGIQSRFPEWEAAKLRGLIKHGHYDPEKAGGLPPMGPAREAEIKRLLAAKLNR